MNKHKQKNTRIVLWIYLLCLPVVGLHAQGIPVDINRNNSVWEGNYYPSVFYFPINKHLLIRYYRNNAIMLDALDALVESKQVCEALETIEIIGACSPTGSEEHNMKLALSRCMALRSYLRWKHLQFAESFPIKFNIIGIDRLGYQILKKQKPPLTEKQIWDELQYAAIRLKMKDGSYIIPGADKPKEFSDSGAEISSKTGEPVYNTPDTVIVLQKDTIYMSYIQNQPDKPSKPLHIALKTNLLYDVALLPNLTVEWYMGKQWSLAVEGNENWWIFGSPVQDRQYYRIQMAGIELRRWFKSPYPLHGHALGIYSMIGNYDARFSPKDENSTGYLSYLSWSAGLSYAYSFPIARRFNLELGLAAGYVGGRYYKYNYYMPDKEWERLATYNRGYIGPTRASVSLVWLLGTGNYTKLKK